MQSGRTPPRKPGRSLLAVALGAFLPLALLAAFAILEAARTYRELDEARLRGTARAIAAAVDAQLGAYVATAVTLSSGPMLDPSTDMTRFEASARPIAAEFGGSLAVLGPPPDFAVLARTLGQPGGARSLLAYGDVPPALEVALARVFAEGRPFVSDLFAGPVSGRLVMAVLAPVKRNGTVIEAVLAIFEPSALLALLQRQDLPPGGFATIADGRLRILATTADPEGKRTGVAAPPWVGPAVGDRRNGLITGPSYIGTDVVYAFEKLAVAPDWIVLAANPLHVQKAETWRA